MAARAAFVLENLLAARRHLVELVRIWRRLEGVQITRSRIKLIIAIAGNGGRRRPLARPRIGAGNEAVITRKVIDPLVQGGVAHDVRDTPVQLEPCVVQIMPLFYADDVRNLDWQEGAGTAARDHARWDSVINGSDLVAAHRFQLEIRIGV